jgi:hypothetical protein
VSQGGNIGNDTWNADVAAASSVGDGFWSCELRIPYSSLTLTPSAQGAWGVNLCRGKRKPAENSAIARNGAFNVAPDFLTLTPLDVDLSPFFIQIGEPAVQTTLREGQITVALALALTNPDTKEHEVVVTAAFILPNGDTVGARREVRLPPEQAQAVPFDALALPANGDYRLRIVLSDPKTKRSLTVREDTMPIIYSPLEVRLVEPSYRDTIYSSQKLAAVVLELRTPLGAQELRDAELTVSIAAVAGGAPLAEKVVRPVQAVNAVSMDATTLPDGRMLIAGELRSAAGTTLARATQPLFKAPAVTDEWYVDRNLVLCHNGQPLWGYGWFGGAEFENESYTVNFEYHQANLSLAEVRANTEKVLAKGVYSIVDAWPKQVYRVNFAKELTPAEEALLRERIRGLRSIPGLLGYYLEDEPDGHSALPRRYERAREIIVEEDPYHPAFQLCANASSCAPYLAGCDIMFTDPYFRPMRSGPPAMSISLVSAALATASSAAKGRKPIWIVPQAFDFWNIYPDSRTPNFTELRNQWLQCIIGGARGVMWFVSRTRNHDVDTDLGVPFISAEDARLRPALVAPLCPDALSWTAPQPKEFQAAFRHVGDRFYGFAVNTAREAQNGVTLTLASTYSGDLWVVSEGRTVRAVNGVFSDDFALYAGHIYTNDPAGAAGETLAAVEARIAAAKRSRINPDNLARLDLGVKVTVPWGYQDWYPAYPGSVLIDGELKRAQVGGRLDSTNAPKRIEVLFPAPVTAGRALVHGNLGRYELEIQSPDGTWKRVAQGENTATATPSSVSFPQESLHAVALKAFSAVGGGNLYLTEIEVFAK